MKEYIKLMRVKHYIKNILVFLPIVFSKRLFEVDLWKNLMLGFISFCMISSAVYILNDYRDIEKDRLHPTKKNRPLASGKVSKKQGFILFLICLVLAIGLIVYVGNILATILIIAYFILNIMYSMGLKDKPIIDIVILASGFVIRVVFGGAIIGIEISKWLYLVIVTGSLYMGLGKRRNELKMGTKSRKVLKYYNEDFLDKNMYMCATLAEVFYVLWTVELKDKVLIWSVPVFIIIMMRYSMNIEGESDGDPVEVILSDKVLCGLVLVYAICIFAMLYLMR